MFESGFNTRMKQALPCLVLVVFSLGCGASVPTGTVGGAVKVKGKPAKAGTVVTYVSDKGDTATGIVGDDGTYQLRNIGSAKPELIPAGNYKIAVATGGGAQAMTDEEYEAMMNSGGKAPEVKKDTSIPTKYATAQTSGLTFEVKTGANTNDIAID